MPCRCPTRPAPSALVTASLLIGLCVPQPGQAEDAPPTPTAGPTSPVHSGGHPGLPPAPAATAGPDPALPSAAAPAPPPASPSALPWAQPAPQPGGGYPPPASAPPPTPYGPPPPPPGYGYGHGYGYEIPPPPPPATLPYEEGQTIPEGYQVGSEIRKGLVIAGAVTLGSLYLISAGAAAAGVDEPDERPDDWAPLFVPIAGPFIGLATLAPTAAGTMALLLDGLGQSSGLAMLVAGLAARKDVLIRNDLGATRLTVTPAIVGRRAVGLGIVAEM